MAISPRVVVIGGVNGSGKTTAAQMLLRSLAIPVFVNADAIAVGLNAMNPEGEAFQAGRLILETLRRLADERADFAFETTLASRAYAQWLRSLKDNGYRVSIFYYWLASPEVAVARVQQRMRSGGHAIREIDIRRRYPRSVRNFLNLYRPMADEWEVYDNTNGQRQLIAMGYEVELDVESAAVWKSFVGSQSDGHAG
jgi:predicted ABC-type ATPase